MYIYTQTKKHGTFDFHRQAPKPYHKKKMLLYVSEKGWIIFDNEILCRRSDRELCISAENGYKQKKI